MEQLGHSQIAVTANTYAHILPAAKQRSAERMGAWLEQAQGYS